MPRRLRRCVIPALVPVLLALVGVTVVTPRRAGAAADSTGVTTRVSVRSGGAQADAQVPAGAGGADLFVYDRSSSSVTRVSVADDGSQANGDSRSPPIAVNGSTVAVAFTSSATNHLPGDTRGKTNVYVRTRGANPSTQLVSVATTGSPGDDNSDEPSLNGNGTQVAFSSDATDLLAKPGRDPSRGLARSGHGLWPGRVNFGNDRFQAGDLP